MTRFRAHVNPHLYHKYCDTDHNPSTILPVRGRYLDYAENERILQELEEIKQDAVGAHFGRDPMAPFYGKALQMEQFLNELLEDCESISMNAAAKEDLERTVDTARANCMTIAGFMPKTVQRTVLSLPLANGSEVDFVWEDGAVYYVGSEKTFLGTAATNQAFRTIIQKNLNHMLMHLLSEVED